MVLSLIATTGMVLGVLSGILITRTMRRSNLIVTTLGILLGAGLLLAHPIGSRCLELTAYVVVFSFAYHFVNTRSEKLVGSIVTR